MAEKTYKFVSVCERPKPVQTNNSYQFTWHVAFCKTCLEKLPEGILKQLEPKLSQFISERAKPKIPGPAGPIKLPAEQKPPIETIALTADDEKIKKGIKPGIITKDKPEVFSPPVPKADKEQQSQFDGLIKNSPVFQGLTKVVEGLESNLTGQIKSLGDMMQTRMEQVFKGISAERGVEKTEEEPPPDRTPPPENPPGTMPGGDTGRGGRPSVLGQSGPLPAGMRDDYKAGDRPPPQVPPLDLPPGREQPPLGGGQQPPPGIEQPPPPDTTGEGMPKLQTPEQISLFKRYVAEEEARLAGGEKVPAKKVDDMLGTAKSSVGLLREVVDIFKGRGESQPSTLAGTPIGEMLSMVKGVNDLTMGNFKGMFEMIKAVREAEKLIWTEPPASRGSSTPQPPPGTKEPPPREPII